MSRLHSVLTSAIQSRVYRRKLDIQREQLAMEEWKREEVTLTQLVSMYPRGLELHHTEIKSVVLTYDDKNNTVLVDGMHVTSWSRTDGNSMCSLIELLLGIQHGYAREVR